MFQAIDRVAIGKTGLLKSLENERYSEMPQRTEKEKLRKDDSISLEHLLYIPEKRNEYDKMKLCVPTFKGFAVLKLEDIIICEAEKNYTIIHLKDKKNIIVSRPLLEYENILEGTTFLRIHRTFLINLQHVTEYHRGEGGVIIMSNGEEVEISRRKKDIFQTRIREIFRY